MAKINQAGRSLTEVKIALGFMRYMGGMRANPTGIRHEFQKMQDFDKDPGGYAACCADTLIRYANGVVVKGDGVENNGIIVTFADGSERFIRLGPEAA